MLCSANPYPSESVYIVCDRNPFIGLIITIIVETITYCFRFWMHCGVVIITVTSLLWPSPSESTGPRPNRCFRVRIRFQLRFRAVSSYAVSPEQEMKGENTNKNEIGRINRCISPPFWPHCRCWLAQSIQSTAFSCNSSRNPSFRGQILSF